MICLAGKPSVVEHLLPKFELAESQPTSEKRAGVMACPRGLQGALTTEVVCKQKPVATNGQQAIAGAMSG